MHSYNIERAKNKVCRLMSFVMSGIVQGRGKKIVGFIWKRSQSLYRHCTRKIGVYRAVRGSQGQSKTQKRRSFHNFSLAGVQGFEPQLADPESAVLPLNDTPICPVLSFVLPMIPYPSRNVKQQFARHLLGRATTRVALYYTGRDWDAYRV